MLLRLIDKGAVYVDKTTGVYKYFADIEKEGCLKAESKSFLKRIYSGSISEFIASFARSGEISAKEIVKLEHLEGYLYQAYVNIEDKGVPYVVVSSRIGYYHG